MHLPLTDLNPTVANLPTPLCLERIHLTPGLGPRLPLTATATEVTQMEADGLLRVAISAEEVKGPSDLSRWKVESVHPGRVFFSPKSCDVMSQEKPGLFGTATGEYFDAAAEFQVFDVPWAAQEVIISREKINRSRRDGQSSHGNGSRQ